MQTNQLTDLRPGISQNFTDLFKAH